MEPKNIIVPLQNWLLARGRCVGCGRLLAGGERHRKNGTIIITCDCQRIFIYSIGEDSYRRALFQEI